MYVFYNIQHFILLSKLQLLDAIINDGRQIITSELRISYYSGQKQLEVRSLAERGLVKMYEHSDDLFTFIEQHEDLFPYAGKGILILVHLCLSSGSILVIENDQDMVRDIAYFFNVPVMPVNEFYRQMIKNQQYHEFLIEHFTG